MPGIEDIRRCQAEHGHDEVLVDNFYAELPFIPIPGAALTYKREDKPDMPDKDKANPKYAIGSMKAPMHYIPLPIKWEFALAMMEGGRKYGDHNYRASGVRASIYYDACNRHLDAFWEGEETDPDSGLPHLAKAMACLAIIRDSQLMGNWVDDRPQQLPDGLNMKRLNELAAQLVAKYPDVKEPFTQVRKDDEARAALLQPKNGGFPTIPVPPRRFLDTERVLKEAQDKLVHEIKATLRVKSDEPNKANGPKSVTSRISCKDCLKVVDCSVSSSETKVCMDHSVSTRGICGIKNCVYGDGCQHLDDYSKCSMWKNTNLDARIRLKIRDGVINRLNGIAEQKINAALTEERVATMAAEGRKKEAERKNICSSCENLINCSGSAKDTTPDACPLFLDVYGRVHCGLCAYRLTCQKRTQAPKDCDEYRRHETFGIDKESL